MKPSDRRYTPPRVIWAVNQFAGGPVALDVASEDANPMGAAAYFRPGRYGFVRLGEAWPTGDQATAEDWSEVVDGGGVGWMNPPFSNSLPWVQRWAGARGTWLAFTAVDYTARWWKVIDGAAMARCELSFRPKSVDPETGRSLRGGQPDFGARVGRHPGALRLRA